MSREEVLKILSVVKSREEAQEDPRTAEAFGMLDEDPRLREAWENQQKWDRAIRTSLKSIPVPVDLKQKILDREKKSKFSVSNVIPLPNSFWIPWAAAALLILGLGIWRIERHEAEKNFALFENQAVDYTRGFFRLSKKSAQLVEIREWLEKKGSPYTFQIPFHLEGLEGIGCRQVEFGGIRSSMICFQIAGSKNEVHLFVMDKNEVKNLPTYGVPDFGELRGNAIAAWTDDRHGYVLTGNIPLEELKKLF